MNDILAGFELFLRQKPPKGHSRKERTIELHLQNFKRLLKSTDNSLTKSAIDTFLLTLLKNGAKGTYANHYVDAIRLYGHYTHREDIDRYPYFDEKPFIKATLSDNEIEQILTLPPKTVVRKSRWGTLDKITFNKGYDVWTLFFSIMAHTGMRPGEVAHLTKDTVDFGRMIFILEDTKTNEPRFVPIPPNLTEDLKAYIARLTQSKLFLAVNGGQSRQGGVFNDSGWCHNFHTRLKRLGIARKNLSVYSLRHSFITRMLEEDVNLFKVQKIVGHRQIATTAHYTHLTTKDLQATISKHPLVRRSTSPKTILNAIIEVFKSFQLQEDERFNYTIEEQQESVTIKIAVK